MAIRDLLWACPLCRQTGSLRANRRSDRCAHCDAAFRRGKGTEIVVQSRDGVARALEAVDWLDHLPATARDGMLPAPTAVRLRIAARKRPVLRGKDLLGWVDEFGPARPGTLALDHEHLRFTGDDGVQNEWALDDLTAVQPSSNDLQIKARAMPVVAIRFLTVSVRLWEEAIQNAIRNRWRLAGKGEVVEFQPRIRS